MAHRRTTISERFDKIYRENAPLFELDSDPQGFDWLVVDDAQNSVFAFERRSSKGERIIVISNFTPVPRHDYRMGVNVAGQYHEIFKYGFILLRRLKSW